MKQKLRNFFTNRWVLASLGLLLIALLIWFVGDAIAFYDKRPLESRLSRALLILFVIVVWAAVEGWKRYRAWRANKQMLAALAHSDDPDQTLSEREVAELRQRFEHAVGTLKKARFENKARRSSSYLYQLPWYVFIGAPGSGKTTALINSGLRFPLAETLGKDAIRGVGGTRNCDWWFTDEAVLLDTAGRYTTQSSNQAVDSSAWLGFLKLIRRFRPRQPLNGAFITLSLSDLLTQSAAERAGYARAVRQRIQELYTQLGCRFPLYVLVTKSDLMAGFMEYFSDLGREDRGQVWGMTFDFAQGHAAPLAAFEAEFDRLSERLYSRHFALLETERDPQRRALMYAFPQQFDKLKPLIASFLAEVFDSSAFEEQAMLRGVYFTSGTQEGSPIDRVLGNLARTFALERAVLPPAASSGKSYFITRMMREVAFAESDLTGQSEKIERRSRTLRLAAYGAAAVFALLLSAGWLMSYFANTRLIADVETQTTALAKQVAQLPPPQADDLPTVLPALNAARALPAGYASRDADVPFSLGLGLYQGDKLGAQADSAYLKLLRDVFLPRIALRLEAQIQDADNPELRYEALKAYLMLYTPGKLDAAALADWVQADWLRTLPREVTETERDQLAAHLQAALTQTPLDMILPQNRALVSEARQALAASSLAQRAYSRLQLLGGGGEVPDFRVSEAAGASAPLVLARESGKSLNEGISGLYTARGYKTVFKRDVGDIVKQLAAEEAWVFGPEFAASRPQNTGLVQNEVLRLYLADYIRVWDELLADLRLVPANSLAESIQSITVLSAGDSPLKMLILAVARETRLAAKPSAADNAAAKAKGKVMSTLKQKFNRFLGSTPAAAPAAALAATPEAQVDLHFDALHKLVAGNPPPIDAVLSLLKEYEIQLRATEEAVKRGAPPPTDAMMLARIQGEADRLPPPARNLLESLISRTTGQAASFAQAGLKKALAGGAGNFCKQAVAGRYPFARASAREVALGDFSRLFGPGGALDLFFRTNLQSFVDASGPVWKPIGLAEGVASVSNATVTQFQRASVIRDAFFPGGSPNPNASAELALVKLDDGLNEVVLSTDGQNTRFVKAQPGATRLLWPSLNPGNQIKLTALGAGNTTTTLNADGPWALFRLLDKAKFEGGQPDRYRISFSFNGQKATFEVRGNSVHNPFRLRELGQFGCPV